MPSPITQIFLWWAVFDSVGGTQAQHHIAGYRFQNVVAYYLLTMVSRAFSSMPGLASGIALQIRNGEINKFLNQPIDLLGFLLLSQTYFSVLRAGWAWERIPVEPHMAKRWVLYSLIALGLISLLAFLLPTQYSLGLLSTLSFIFSALSALAYAIFFLIFNPSAVLAWPVEPFIEYGPGADRRPAPAALAKYKHPPS